MSEHIGKYVLLESLEETVTAREVRAGEIANGRLAKHCLASIITPKLTAIPGFRDQYRAHSQNVSKLEHPNILAKIETVDDGKQLAAVYAFQEAVSLQKIMARAQDGGFPFSADHGLLVVSKIVTALSHAKAKNITHGLLNPSMVLITNEGEAKLRGLTIGTALHATGAKPQLGSEAEDYMPATGFSANRDEMDVFACGAILFEMLTGKRFKQQQGAPAMVVANAVMEVDGEQIPTPVANLLVSSLDRQAPTAYPDTPSMAKDVESLLFSGDFSPTTFNLAFYMHSAFREEMEASGEKIAAEKDRDYGSAVAAASAAPPPSPPKATVAAPADASVSDPVVAPVRAQTTRVAPAEKSSKLPIIIGAVAVVIAAVLAYVFFIMPKDEDTGSSLAAERERLERQEQIQKAEEDRKQQEELQRQNALLREQVQEQNRLENERRKRELEEEMAAMDRQIAELKTKQEQAKRQKELEDRLAQLEQERQDFLAKEKARQEQEEARLKAEQEAEALANNPQPEDGVETNTNESADGADPATADNAPPEQPADAGADDPSMPVEAPEVVIDDTPPETGELVPLDDPLLNIPQLLEVYPSEKAPRRAVREGLVEKDRMISFLVRVLVDEEGRIEEAMLHKSPLPLGADDYGMIEKAERAARRIKFSPPTKLGVRVKVWMIVSIHFRGS